MCIWAKLDKFYIAIVINHATFSFGGQYEYLFSQELVSMFELTWLIFFCGVG